MGGIRRLGAGRAAIGVIAVRRRLPAVLLVALLALPAGCSDVVGGTGSLNAAPQPGGPASQSTGAPAPPTGCPRVVYPGAQLSFDCITSGMRLFRNGAVWPVSVRRTVEPSTGWLLEEGGGHWGSADGVALVDIALNVRQQMLDIQSYGAAPDVRTTVSHPTHVDGKPAYLVQTTFNLNPAWARQAGTKVRQERLWMLAIEVAPNDVSLWYVSRPDLARSLWAKVPAVIASIKVN